ncbi:daptide biosynthesis RiPP recognition protein [Streptomyces sp. NPDC013178]|uniref:daptide biosynthesis RiPP recognition protein n=1 Tax=Streptomyces sp. NPDC013178 TaxID=3155118 RepID=UPI0033F013A3
MDTPTRRRAKDHIMSWGAGGRRPASVPEGSVATIVLADARHLDAVTASGLTGPGTLVFVPGTGEASGNTIPYGGSLADPGADFALGEDFYLQTQDYASSAYMSVLGPTLIRVFGLEDFSAFVADADRALHEGVFPEFLITPAVLLADTAALGGPRDGDGPALRLYVDAEGRVSTSPSGSPLGTVGDDLASLLTRYEHVNAASEAPCAVSLGGAVPEEARTAALQTRPFLGRYLAAVRTLRALTAQDVGGLKVSGFGHRLTNSATGDADLRDPALPLVLWNTEQAYVVAGGRVFAVDHAFAAAVERLLTDTADSTGANDATAPLPVHVRDQVRAFFTDRGLPLDIPTTRIPAGAR